MKKIAAPESAAAALATDELRLIRGALELGFGFGASLTIGGKSKPRPVVAPTAAACTSAVAPVVQPVARPVIQPVYAAPAPVYAAPVYGWPYC